MVDTVKDGMSVQICANPAGGPTCSLAGDCDGSGQVPRGHSNQGAREQPSLVSPPMLAFTVDFLMAGTLSSTLIQEEHVADCPHPTRG